MAEDDRLWNKPTELIKILITLAPDINVRVALLEVVDYILDFQDGDTLDTDDLLEVVVESISLLHHHVGDDGDCGDEEVGAPSQQEDDFSGMSADEIVEAFRKQMENKKKDK